MTLEEALKLDTDDIVYYLGVGYQIKSKQVTFEKGKAVDCIFCLKLHNSCHTINIRYTDTDIEVSPERLAENYWTNHLKRNAYNRYEISLDSVDIQKAFVAGYNHKEKENET